MFGRVFREIICIPEMAAPFHKAIIWEFKFWPKIVFKAAKITKKDNIWICFSKILTYSCDLDGVQNEPVRLPFEERFKATTLTKSYW